MLKLAISGATGRMGRLIMAMAASDGYFEITAAFERSGHPNLKNDAGEVCGIGKKIYVDLQEPSLEAIRKCDMIIEFTTPDATMSNLALALSEKKPMVIGTTGLSEPQIKKIEDAARIIPIVFSPNMSLGVNLLFDLVKTAAASLTEDYDIEIVEAHHNMKKDAPSGTAKRLAEVAAEARHKNLNEIAIYGRPYGQIGERPKGQIGIHAIRAGDIVGDHTVIFSTRGERLELTHRAHSREAFAQGALKACKFINLTIEKKPGLYSMKDVLGR